MMRLTIVVAFTAVLAVGCKDKAGNRLSQCGVSVGACAMHPDASCGVSFGCKDKNYHLKCTPPTSTETKELECTCIENSVIGKTVRLTWPMQGEAAEVASTACGWPK